MRIKILNLFIALTVTMTGSTVLEIGRAHV